MIYILNFVYAFNFKEKYGYRIKMAGDEERYLVNIKGTVRAILAVDLDSIQDAQYVVELVKVSGGAYKVKFCVGYLSALSPSTGVVAHDNPSDPLTTFEIKKVGSSLQLYNKTKNECITQISTYDPVLKGFRYNSRKCDGSKDLMVLLDVGPIYYYCQDQAEMFCMDNGYEKINSNIIDHHMNLWNDGSSSEFENSSFVHENKHHEETYLGNISDPFRHFSLRRDRHYNYGYHSESHYGSYEDYD